MRIHRFPSPVGDFVFISLEEDYHRKIKILKFPSPVGDFVFISITTVTRSKDLYMFPSPVGDFVFISEI